MEWKKLRVDEDVEVRGKGLKLHIITSDKHRFEVMKVEHVIVMWGEGGLKEMRLRMK